MHAVVDVLDGELLTGDDRALTGRVWVHAIVARDRDRNRRGDIVVVGDRPERSGTCSSATSICS